MSSDDAYDARVAQILSGLGIPATYGLDRQLPAYVEAEELVSVGMDIHGRERQLTPRAAGRWNELRAAAHQEGVALLLVSAFRSLEYQRLIFERKLEAGESLERILKVNTPPGYSEHHTGRAVDLTTPDCPPLVEEFETTAAFGWLVREAHRFDFTMTYPRENRFGMAYEPWHWAVQDQAAPPGGTSSGRPAIASGLWGSHVIKCMATKRLVEAEMILAPGIEPEDGRRWSAEVPGNPAKAAQRTGHRQSALRGRPGALIGL